MRLLWGWIRCADHLEGLGALAFGFILMLQPLNNDFNNLELSLILSIIFVSLGVVLLTRDIPPHLFFMSVMLRVFHTGYVLTAAISNSEGGDYLIVVAVFGSVIYAVAKKIDEMTIGHPLNAARTPN